MTTATMLLLPLALATHDVAIRLLAHMLAARTPGKAEDARYQAATSVFVPWFPRQE